MKRSPLTRRTPLKRTGWLRRSKPAARSLGEREAKLAFEAACYGKPCAVCETTVGIIDAHHVLSKLRIKNRVAAIKHRLGALDESDETFGLSRLLWDPRNAMPLCREVCHANHTNAYRRVPRHLIPEAAWEFAAELGLTHVLERQYPEERKAA